MADVNALKPAAATRWVAEANGSDPDALSQMSTDRKRASVRRWITGATGSTRMLHRRCQRAGHGPQ
jgi:hypothetical protein